MGFLRGLSECGRQKGRAEGVPPPSHSRVAPGLARPGPTAAATASPPPPACAPQRTTAPPAPPPRSICAPLAGSARRGVPPRSRAPGATTRTRRARRRASCAPQATSAPSWHRATPASAITPSPCRAPPATTAPPARSMGNSSLALVGRSATRRCWSAWISAPHALQVYSARRATLFEDGHPSVPVF